MAEIITLSAGGKSLEYAGPKHEAVMDIIRSLDASYRVTPYPEFASLLVNGVKLIAYEDPLGRCLISSDPAGDALLETICKSLSDRKAPGVDRSV